MGFREQPGALFEVEFLTVADAEGEKVVIGGLALEVEDDMPRAPAQRGVVAHRVRTKPLRGGRPAGNDLLADRAVNGWVLVRQQADQGEPLALRELFR